MAWPTRVKTRICAWQVGVWWRTRTPGRPSRSLERCRSSFKMSMGQSSSGCSCSCALRTPGQHVTDSSFVEQGVNRRGRMATATSASAWADLWRDVWREINAWGSLGDNLSVRKVKAHTTPEAVLAGVITPDDRAGNDLADAACKLVVLEHRAPPNFREAFGQLGRHTHGSLDCARWFCETAFGLDLDSWAWTSDYL